MRKSILMVECLTRLARMIPVSVIAQHAGVNAERLYQAKNRIKNKRGIVNTRKSYLTDDEVLKLETFLDGSYFSSSPAFEAYKNKVKML